MSERQLVPKPAETRTLDHDHSMAISRYFLRRASLAAKIALSASLLIFLFSQVDVHATKKLILRADPTWIPLVFIFYLLQIGSATKRWCYVLGGLRENFPFMKALRLVMVGQFFNQCLPSNIGGDAMRMFYLRNAGINTQSAISSVLLDRIMGLIVLIILATVSLPFLANRIDNPLAIMGLGTLVGIGWVAILVLFLLDNPLTKRFHTHKILSVLVGLSQNARALLIDRTAAVGVLSTSILIHFCSIGIAWTIDMALGGNASFIVYVFAMVPTLLVVSIPISIAGWGVREQALIIILGGLGITSAHALSVSILFGFSLIILSAPGVIFWILINQNRKRPRRPILETLSG
jgi:glycosyltransferase 2 family protein